MQHPRGSSTIEAELKVALPTLSEIPKAGEGQLPDGTGQDLRIAYTFPETYTYMLKYKGYIGINASVS